MTTGSSPLARGRRAPDFALPQVGGDGPVRFYGRVGGRPVVLVFTGDAGTSDDPVAGLLGELATSLPDHAEVHVISRAELGGPPDAFIDAGGQVHDAYGASDGGPVAVVLGPELRVRATVPADGPAAATSIVAAVPDAPTDDGLAPRLAPVLFVPDALSPAWCGRLMDRFTTHGSVETGVETVVDGARAEATDVRRKRRRDHTVTDQTALRELTQHLGARLFPELQRAFAFAGGGFEGFKIGCYDAADAGHFVAHRDNLSTGTAHRRFGLSVGLNDDYDGGELVFPEHGATRYRPAAGEALLFSGSLLHEVQPVTRGQRFALLSFVLAKR